jgi:hypothetical protein
MYIQISQGLHCILVCLLKARIVEPEKESFLGNGCVTRNIGITVRNGVIYSVRADSYVK